MTSISTGGKYYWAKALSNKVDQRIHGVKFSTDGALLIAHSGSSSNFIIVFNVKSGNILSARNYLTGGNDNFSDNNE
jgi:glucose/arabinose dehydrogenase